MVTGFQELYYRCRTFRARYHDAGAISVPPRWSRRPDSSSSPRGGVKEQRVCIFLRFIEQTTPGRCRAAGILNLP